VSWTTCFVWVFFFFFLGGGGIVTIEKEKHPSVPCHLTSWHRRKAPSNHCSQKSLLRGSGEIRKGLAETKPTYCYCLYSIFGHRFHIHMCFINIYLSIIHPSIDPPIHPSIHKPIHSSYLCEFLDV